MPRADGPRTMIAVVALTASVVSACGGADVATPAETPVGATEATAATTADAGDWYRPAVGASWQWQLTGDLDTGFDVDVYDVDLFDVPAEGIAALQADGSHVVCYFSAGSSEDWRADFGDFDPSVLGEQLDDWEGERWLDVRSDGVRLIMMRRLDLARRKGCDGVEPDNVQGYTSDTGFGLTDADLVEYTRSLAAAAHERGLAIGLKNAAELIPELIDDVDFSVNEQCHEFDECAPYRAFVAAGKPVFNAEYAERYVTDPDARAELCEMSAVAGFRTLVLPLDLDGSFRHAC